MGARRGSRCGSAQFARDRRGRRRGRRASALSSANIAASRVLISTVLSHPAPAVVDVALRSARHTHDRRLPSSSGRNRLTPNVIGGITMETATATRVTSAVPGRRTPRRRACSHPTRRPAKSSPSVTPSPTNNVPIYEPRERRRTGETASRAARHRPIRPAHATISGAPCHPLGPKVNPAIVPAFSLMHPRPAVTTTKPGHSDRRPTAQATDWVEPSPRNAHTRTPTSGDATGLGDPVGAGVVCSKGGAEPNGSVLNPCSRTHRRVTSDRSSRSLTSLHATVVADAYASGAVRRWRTFAW